jgi:2-polyprenyl-3-methyl-5-hydroxy-6-metoxy-1,4-benzoquinol methylase
MNTGIRPAEGKPAERGQLIIARRHRISRNHLSFKGKTVLDFGCGNGAQALAFVADGCTLIGVDVQLDQLHAFRLPLNASPETPTSIVCYDGRVLPLRDQCCDAVLSFEVLEHVAYEEAALREIRRVMRPGADLLLTVPNKWWLFETHGANLPLLPWNRVPFFSWLPQPLHERFARARVYTRRRIHTLLRKTGFGVLTSEYVTAPMDMITSPGLQKVLRATVFRQDTTRWGILATAIFIHARKDR